MRSHAGAWERGKAGCFFVGFYYGFFPFFEFSLHSHAGERGVAKHNKPNSPPSEGWPRSGRGGCSRSHAGAWERGSKSLSKKVWVVLLIELIGILAVRVLTNKNDCLAPGMLRELA